MLWFKSIEEKIAGLRARRDALHRMFADVKLVADYYIDEELDLTQKIAELECRRGRRLPPFLSAVK